MDTRRQKISTTQDFLQWAEEQRGTPYHESLQEARKQVALLDLDEAARRSGAGYRELDDGSVELILPLLGREYLLRFPGPQIVDKASGREPSPYRQIILLHYLAQADDTIGPAGLVSFDELQHGRPYVHSLREGGFRPLAAAYADAPGQFRLAAAALGGHPLPELGDLAFAFRPLPLLVMGIVLMPGDEEFPGEVKLLVDASSEHHLPTYDLAVLARLLCQTLAQLRPVEGEVPSLSSLAVDEDGALYGAP